MIFIKICKVDVGKLTTQEIEILLCVFNGLPNKLISIDLRISLATVELHKRNIVKKKKVGFINDLFKDSSTQVVQEDSG